MTSECSSKRVICKTWTGTLANGADLDQTLRPIRGYTVCLNYRKLRLNKTVVSPRSGPFSQSTLRDNQPNSAVSTLIAFHNTDPDQKPLFMTSYPGLHYWLKFFCPNTYNKCGKLFVKSVII